MFGVAIHLTPWAPGCADLSIDDDSRWLELGHVSPDQVIAWLEETFDRPANQLALRAAERLDGATDTRVFALVEDEPQPVMVAVIHAGADFETLKSARAARIAILQQEAA